MNLTIGKRDLYRLASRMAGVADRKSTMPVLSSVLIRASGKSVGLAATDLYLALDGAASADIETPGSIAVGAKDFLERLKMMPEGPISLTTKDNTLVMKAVGTARRYTLRGMPGDDFPPMPKPGDAASRMSIDVGAFSSLINLTSYAISTDETRAHLNSLLVQREADLVRMVSTDGHRLAKAERKLAGGEPSEMLIPLKAVQEIKRIADELYAQPDEARPPMDVVRSGAHVFFVGSGLTFGVKLVDAQFPPYSQVIPKTCAHSLRAPRAALLDAIKAVAVSAHERTGGLKLTLTKGLLRLSSESPDSGDGSDEVPVEYSGPNMAIGVAARYVVDVLAVLTTDEVDLGLGGELDPIVIRPVNDSNTDSIAVVMPLRI